LASRGEKASFQERRVLAQLVACRTAALGGHAWSCDACGAIRADYNSCGNRHCPTCRGSARAKWLDRVREDLLPVPYFHVVQTLPHEPQLDRLVLANRALLFGLLFHSTAAALLELAADPKHLGARIGLLMLLHTWGQLMDLHTHVHIVVPGGGLSPDGTSWISCRNGFFLPVEVIGALVRGKFLAGLKRLWRAGKLKLDGKLSPLRSERTFESWLATLYAKNWVAFVQGPPEGIKGPDAVLKYLARYVSGVAISDRRLVSHTNGCVTFRWKNYARGGTSQTTPPLPGVEFVRRYLLHVLPRGFVRIRAYGLLSNRRRQTDLARCRALLAAQSRAAAIPVAAPTTPTTPAAAVACTGSARPDASTCATCRRGRLVLLESWPRPTVWDLVARQASPPRPRAARSTARAADRPAPRPASSAPAPRSAVAGPIASARSLTIPVENTS
jgi:hypothetical protein